MVWKNVKKRLKKYFPTHQSFKNSKELKSMKSFLKSDHFWSYDCQPVARGVAAGLAGAVIPGFQFFYSVILVIILRGNLPIALACTLVTNPLTAIPITYFIYYIGTLIIKNGSAENFVIKDFQWSFSNFHSFWQNLTAWLMQFGKGFLVGLPIVSVAFGLVGYFATLLIWKIYKIIYKKK
jgi:uncharacterized protein (DUF2062 family)